MRNRCFPIFEVNCQCQYSLVDRTFTCHIANFPIPGKRKYKVIAVKCCTEKTPINICSLLITHSDLGYLFRSSFFLFEFVFHWSLDERQWILNVHSSSLCKTSLRYKCEYDEIIFIKEFRSFYFQYMRQN